MGAGKSSVGRALGQQLGWAFEDLDHRIERREGRKVSEIFREFGENAFRQAEHAALKELLGEAKLGAGTVIALGGGAFAQKNNAKLVESSGVVTVFLDADAAELWRRCRDQAKGEGVERPLLGSAESFRKLYEDRRAHYLKASFRQETRGKTVAESTDALILALDLIPRRKGRTKDRSGGQRGKRQGEQQ